MDKINRPKRKIMFSSRLGWTTGPLGENKWAEKVQNKHEAKLGCCMLYFLFFILVYYHTWPKNKAHLEKKTHPSPNSRLGVGPTPQIVL